MRQDRAFRRQASVSRRHLSVGERTAEFLRQTHPEKTAANVAADTRGRMSAKTVEKMLERQSAPSAANWLVLLETYGPEFICAVMDAAPAWVDQAARTARRARVTAMRDRLSQLLEQEDA